MQAASFAALTGGLLAFAASGSPCQADNEKSLQPAEPTVTLHYVDADINTVVADVQRQTGMEIVVTDDISRFGRIDVQLVSAPLAVALLDIEGSADAESSRDDDGEILIRPKREPQCSPSKSDTTSYQYRKLTLRFAKPWHTLETLGWDQDCWSSHPQGCNLPDGVDHIYPIQVDNSLLIHSTLEAFNRIRYIVRQLDVQPVMVSLRVDQVTVDMADLDGLLPDGMAKTPLTTSQVEAALIKRGGISSVTNYLTENNKSVDFIETCTSLNVDSVMHVTPRINRDHTIALFMSPKLPERPASMPPITYASLVTMRTVANGSTADFGLPYVVVRSRIPVLSDLPLIGTAFQSRNKTVSDKSLVIFITPTIVDDKPALKLPTKALRTDH